MLKTAVSLNVQRCWPYKLNTCRCNLHPVQLPPPARKLEEVAPTRGRIGSRRGGGDNDSYNPVEIDGDDDDEEHVEDDDGSDFDMDEEEEVAGRKGKKSKSKVR